jgi:hypothetical protein
MASAARPSKLIPTAILTLFFGTIALGALSFVIWFGKERERSSRTERYAAALRDPLNETALRRHQSVIESALLKPAAESSMELHSYFASSMGPENMGYTLRTITPLEGDTRIAFDAELTGTQRSREIVLVLAGLNATRGSDAVLAGGAMSRPLAALLGVAHSQTAQPRARTLRFAVIDEPNSLPRYYEKALDGRERISHLVLLGGATEMSDAQALAALHHSERGTVVLRPAFNGTVLADAQELERVVIELAERP